MVKTRVHGKTRRNFRPRVSFPCLNCDGAVVMGSQAKLYCREECAEEAKTVRYVRRCLHNGRISDAYVQEAILIRLGMVMGGGYPEKERRVLPSIRRVVIARDGGRCRKCGKPGGDIDHIEGGSNEMENLQLLCRSCHNKKTLAGLVEITTEDEGYEEAMMRRKRLTSRINALVPKRPCDNDKHWDSVYPRILLERRRRLSRCLELLEHRTRAKSPRATPTHGHFCLRNRAAILTTVKHT